MNNLSIRLLNESDLPLVIDSIATLGWSIDINVYKNYILKHLEMKDPFWIMLDGNVFVGHVLLKWSPEYTYFNENNIPEIANLMVMPNYLRMGYATKLMDVAEAEAKTKSKLVGLGVGLYKDYGPAQKLYMKRGYKLDGNGITYNCESAIPGHKVMVDDDLLIWLIKEI